MRTARLRPPQEIKGTPDITARPHGTKKWTNTHKNALEGRETGTDLCKNATHTPHVNRATIRQPEDNLRGAIETRLEVCVRLLILDATAAEIDDPNRRFGEFTQKDVLWLQITMQNALLPIRTWCTPC